ncbi:MAG TPA: hypothetical protein DD733_00895, partial [Clostridiales bacterium]|nr:hypothetical protein [Clostridiales bacterium]
MMTKADIIEIGKRIYEKNYTAAHDGNISFYDGKTVFITPSGVSKGFMSEDGISELTIDGRVLNGAVPSSEYKMHLAVYKNNPSVHAVVHTHPVYATTFACMGKPLKSEVLAEAVFQLGDIPLAEY